jgi:hypothetical protein
MYGMPVGEARAEVVGELQQALVVRHLVRGEQAAEDADGDLEVLDLDVLVEGELVDDELLRLRRLVVEAHDQHRVQRVDGRHQQ